MKTKEELIALKGEIETLNKKLAELSEEELAQVIGGLTVPFDSPKQTVGNRYSEYSDIGNTAEPFDIHFYKNTINEDFQPKFC